MVMESEPQKKSARCSLLGSTHHHVCYITATVSHTQGNLALYPDDRCQLCLVHIVLGVLGMHVMLAHKLLWIQNDTDYMALEFSSSEEASEWATFITYPIFATPPITTPDISEKSSSPQASVTSPSFPSPVFLRNTLTLHRHAPKPVPPSSSPSVELLGRSPEECHRIQVEKLVIAEKLKQKKRRHDRQELEKLVRTKWNELQTQRALETASAVAYYRAKKEAAPDILLHQIMSRLRQAAPPSVYHYRVGMAVAALIVQRLWRGYRVRLSVFSMRRLRHLHRQIDALQEKTENLHQEMLVNQMPYVPVYEEPKPHSIIILPPVQRSVQPQRKLHVATDKRFSTSPTPRKSISMLSQEPAEVHESHCPFADDMTVVIPPVVPVSPSTLRNADSIESSVALASDERSVTPHPPSEQKRYSISIEPDNPDDIADEMKEEVSCLDIPYIANRPICTEEGSPVSILMEYLQRKGKAVPRLPMRSIESPNRQHRRLSQQSMESSVPVESDA